MNETMIDIWGIIALISLASPLIGLLAIIAYKVYRKFRPSKEKARIERQPERALDEPSLPHNPSGPQRAIVEFIAVTFLIVCAGALTGVIAALLSYLMYILFVFPLVMGVASGGLIIGAIWMGKLRKISQLIFLSLLAAITLYGTYHYTRYIGLQVQTSLEMFPGFSQATEDKNLQAAKAFVDDALEEETGYSGFVGYMLFKAKEGVSIGRFYQSNRLKLGPTFTWLYWTMEFGIILWITIRMGKKFAASLCEFCGNLYGSEKHLGGTTNANESLILDLIKQRDFIELGKLIEENAELPSLELYFRGCNVCNKSHSHLALRQVFQGPRGRLQFTDRSKTVLQPQDKTLLLSQLKFIGN